MLNTDAFLLELYFAMERVNMQDRRKVDLRRVGKERIAAVINVNFAGMLFRWKALISAVRSTKSKAPFKPRKTMTVG